MKIPVLWWERVVGDGDPHARSRYGTCTLLNQLFDNYDCEHWNEWKNFPADASGAVVMIAGGNLLRENPLVAQNISHAVAGLKYVIFVVFGDEEAEFPLADLVHPNSRTWVQTPWPGRTKADRYLIVGYPNDCVEMLRNHRAAEKDLEYFFSGQITHPRREACLAALQSCGRHGVIAKSTHFGGGLDHPTYFNYMSRAKVVPCPSGPATPDTYRMCEALEAGAVPIIDTVSLPGVRGYWEITLPGNPLPFVNEWDELPRIMDAVLNDYDRVARAVRHWWLGYKLHFFNNLSLDLIALGAK